MKKTLQDQYLLIKEGKGHKGVFLTEAKRQFPDLIPNSADVKLAAQILKDKNIINENIVGLQSINQMVPTKKESFETAFETFLKEAKKTEEKDKAEAKSVSKSVEKKQEHAHDNTDEKNIDKVIFDQVMTGYYAELKDPKNADKTMEQLKDIVLKNLAKDPIHYTKDGQFGIKGLGYTTEHPGLGEPKEAKGKYASSGYGNLNENKQTQTMSINESKLRNVIRTIIREELNTQKPLNENVHKRLKEIDTEVQDEVMQSKLAKVCQEIEKREAQLKMIDENDDLRELTDKSKIKALHKEIKLLEKAKAKLEKANKGKKKEVLDESDEPSQEYLDAKANAEERYNGGEDIESIIADYPQFKNELYQDIIGGFEGMDY